MGEEENKKKSKSNTFPKRIYNILKQESSEGTSEIISWLPCGRGFIIYDKKKFEKIFLMKHFQQTTFRSFLRQLNIYGFKRVEFGRFQGGYEHDFFVRDQPQLISQIKRKPIKSTL